MARYGSVTDQRFDAMAVDLEYPQRVADPSGWDKLLHLCDRPVLVVR